MASGLPFRYTSRESAEAEAAAIAEATKVSAERWHEYFDTALHCVLDEEARPDSVGLAVSTAAAVADSALEEFEKRWANA